MKPNAHYTDIAFILDRSGSMGSCQQAAIDGFNQFLDDQQQIEGLAKLPLDLGLRLAALTDKDRPGQVIVAILTDGLENASQRFNWKEIAGKIKHQTDTYKWIFLFLGANQDAIATASNLSIAANNAANYVADTAGSRAGQAAFSRKMSALRRSSMDIASVSDKLDAAASLTDIVSEEDRKSREPESPKS